MLLNLWAYLDSLYPFVITGFILTTIFFLIFSSISLFFTAAGLFTVTTEIDLTKRITRVTRRNFRGQKAVQEVPLDFIQINSVRMGVTDANPEDVWIVKAGFNLVNDAGQHLDIALFSKAYKYIEDRDRVMLELYHFFFPDRRDVGIDNIITNGTLVKILTDSELNKM